MYEKSQIRTCDNGIECLSSLLPHQPLPQRNARRRRSRNRGRGQRRSVDRRHWFARLGLDLKAEEAVAKVEIRRGRHLKMRKGKSIILCLSK